MDVRITRRHASPLAAATAAALTLLASPSHAEVSINPRGYGQVLLFPYYTVNAGNDTYLSVTNATDRGKAVKVTFREGRNGREVLSFNLYLSPYDVWTAGLVSLDANGPANLLTRDTSCTVPAIRTSTFLPQIADGTRYVPFRNFQYSGTARDNGGQSLTRTREGFLEVIEMGELTSGTAATQVLDDIRHRVVTSSAPNSGVPANCNQPIADWDNLSGAWGGTSGNRQADITLPTGGLYGSLQIINVANGTLHSYDATAIQGYYGGTAPAGALHTAPGTSEPTLASASDGSATIDSRVLTDDGEPVVSRWTAGTADAVSALLMRETMINDFDTETALGAASEWVLSFPTKRFYVDSATAALPPFTDPFLDDGKGCETTAITLFDREKPLSIDPPPSECGFLCPPTVPPPQFTACYATQVLSFGQPIQTIDPLETTPSAIFGSRGTADIRPAARGFVADRGVLQVVFPQPSAPVTAGRTLQSLNGDVYHGLPVLGFWSANYVNGDAQPGQLANYSGALPHRYRVRIDRSPSTTPTEGAQ